jgi:2-dehydro-3-deoxygluconokinase
MKPFVGFGEIMGRLAPPGFLRFSQAMPGPMDVTFAGAEANVSVSIANFGGEARFVTALPKHAIADSCVAVLRGLGVDTRFVKRVDEGRLGLYFVETGANQRPSNVVYDRSGSSVSLTPGDAYPWDEIFEGAGWLHVSGITPALSRQAATATLAATAKARAAGLTVSCDLNFRKKLWKWDPPQSAKELAQETMRSILPNVDVVIGNEADASDVLGIQAGASDAEAGRLEIDRYPDVARQIAGQFPGVKKVAITLRESISATHNDWGAMLYDVAGDAAHFAPLVDGAYQPYEIRAIVDRVGGGDAFAGGLIYALADPELCEPAKAVAFAAAASCLAHSIKGDFNYSSRAEVEALAGGAASGRVVR